MKRCIAFVLGASWIIAGAVATATEGQSQRPNILFLFTDDQCFDTIAELGHPEVITPNLDQLARRGVAFTNAYNMGGWSGAICVASRTMMNTGRFLWRAHALVEQKQLAEEVTQGRMVSQIMATAGYETFVSGKWHVKVDAADIFDHVAHIRPGMPKDTPASYSRPNDKGDWLPWDPAQGGFWAGGKHWSEVLADDATKFLDLAAQNDRPFFMYLAFNAPHDPRQSPREFVERYDRQALSIPANFVPENPYMNEMDAGKNLRDEKLAPWPRTHDAVRLHRQEYFALITHLDEQIGRILEHLEQSGQADNTYIVMTADHGLACGQHGLLGKQNMYEHSVKAPLLVVGPGIPEQQRIATPVYVQDFVATALEWAGVERPSQVEFQSLLPLIRGERDTQYPAIYGAYKSNKQRMIRVGDTKLIYYPASDRYLLFDLAADPDELHDLAQESSQAERLNELKKRLHELMVAMDDPLLADTE